MKLLDETALRAKGYKYRGMTELDEILRSQEVQASTTLILVLLLTPEPEEVDRVFK